MTEKLTIVIPTYNRQKFALRTMQYWSGKNVHVIVMDGTHIAIDEKELKKLHSNIEYIHRNTGMYDRICYSLDKIKTEYVALAGDDEYYIQSALQSCIYELERDPNLHSCIGQCLGFHLIDDEILTKPMYHKMYDYSVMDNNPIDRIKYHMTNYVPSTIYSVCRSESWIKAFKNITKHEFRVYAIAEIQFEMCMSFVGKSKAIPELMWLRSHGELNEITSNDPSLDKSLDFNKWWADVNKKNEKKLFVHLMGMTFRDLLNQTNINYEAAVTVGITSYLQFLSPINSTRSLFKRILIACNITPIIKGVRKIMGNSIQEDKIEYKTFEDARNTLEKSKILVDQCALNEIEENINIYYNKNNKRSLSAS